MYVDWVNRIINIARDDLVENDGIYILDVNWLWKKLHEEQYSEMGMAYPNIFENYQPVELSGIMYSRVLKIINDYKVQFEDDKYRVALIGGNNNIVDVLILNQVQVISNNSAGSSNTIGGFTVGSGMTSEQMFRLVLDNNVKLARMMKKFAKAGL